MSPTRMGVSQVRFPRALVRSFYLPGGGLPASSGDKIRAGRLQRKARQLENT